MIKTICLALLSSTLFSSSLLAQDEMDDVLSGFDEGEDGFYSAFEDVGDNDMALNFGGWQLSGSLSVSTAYNYLNHYSSTGTDYEGLSKLRSRVNLEVNKQFKENWKIKLSAYAFYDASYYLRDFGSGRGAYTEEVMDDYEKDFDIQDFYIEGKLSGHWDIKAGRQVVIWGHADSIRVLDILNPLDNLEPGLADIEDIRLPVSMIKLDYYVNAWNLSLIAIPEIRFSKNPPRGSDFYNGSPDSLPLKDKEPEDGRHANAAMALAGSFAGWDISLNAARTWRDSPYVAAYSIDYTNKVLLLHTLDRANVIELKHSRVNMLGGSIAFTSGSYLYKSELAWFDNIDVTDSVSINLFPIAPSIGSISFPYQVVSTEQIDTLIGVEYFGMANTTFSVEIANRHLSSFEDSMKPFGLRENRLEADLRVTRSFLNKRLDVTALGIFLGEKSQNGSIMRLDFSYELQDGLNLSGGIIAYNEGELPPFNTIKDNDRVFAEVKWSF